MSLRKWWTHMYYIPWGDDLRTKRFIFHMIMTTTGFVKPKALSGQRVQLLLQQQVDLSIQPER